MARLIRTAKPALHTIHMVKDVTAIRVLTACGAELDRWADEVTIWPSALLDPPKGITTCPRCAKLPGVTG